MKKKIRKRTVAKKNIVLPKESFLTMKKYQPQIMALKAETKEEFAQRIETYGFHTLLFMYENYITLSNDLWHDRNDSWDHMDLLVNEEQKLATIISERKALLQKELERLHARVVEERDTLREEKWVFDEKLPEAIQTLLNYGL